MLQKRRLLENCDSERNRKPCSNRWWNNCAEDSVRQNCCAPDPTWFRQKLESRKIIEASELIAKSSIVDYRSHNQQKIVPAASVASI